MTARFYRVIIFAVMLVIRKELACCFTGHRVIRQDTATEIRKKLHEQIRRLIENQYCDFITGGARGFDTLAAQAVLKLREEFPHIRLILALPCKNQTRGWSQKEKLQYEEILCLADEVHVLAEHYDSGCMMRRNRFMVDNSAGCVFYLTQMRSGTYKTVAYAMERERKLYNILLKEG